MLLTALRISQLRTKFQLRHKRIVLKLPHTVTNRSHTTGNSWDYIIITVILARGPDTVVNTHKHTYVINKCGLYLCTTPTRSPLSVSLRPNTESWLLRLRSTRVAFPYTQIEIKHSTSSHTHLTLINIQCRPRTINSCSSRPQRKSVWTAE